MADEMDKFVLKYEVETGEAEKALDKLDKKVKSTNDHANEAGEGLKKFASGASDELGKMLPVINNIKSAIGEMTTGFGVAGAAITAVGLGIKAAMVARDQYNAQRVAGRDSGISALRMEDYSRRLVGGNVSRDKVMDNFTKQQDILRKIQSDPFRKNEALQRSVYGLSGFGPDGKPLNNAQFTSEIQKRYQGMTDAQVQAQARNMGMDPDVALSIKNQKQDMMTPQMSLKDAQGQINGAADTAKLNDNMEKFNEQMHELATTLGNDILPKFGSFVGVLANGSKEINDGLKMSKEDKARQLAIETDIKSKNAAAHGGWGWSNGKSDAEYDADVARQAIAKMKSDDEAAAAKKQADAKPNADQAKLAKTFADQDAPNADMQDAAAKQLAAAELFQTTIHGLTGALSQSEIMTGLIQGTGSGPGAVIAGVGAPAGAGAPTGVPGIAGGHAAVPASLQPIFDAANKAHGFPTGTLEGIASKESTFNPKAQSGVGAKGIMQLTDLNSKAYGVTDPYDPEQNINGGAAVYADMLKRAHGDKNLALRMYNAGLKPTAYNKPAVRAYADDVQGRQASYGGAGAATPNNPLGDTPSGNQAAWDRRRAALKLSEMTGMPASQILNQGIAKGDMVKIAPWAKFNAQNEATAAALKVQGIDAATKAGGMVPNGDAARANLDWRTTSANQRALDSSLASGQFQREGGATSLTANVPAAPVITIHAPITINGAHGPEDTANAVKSHLAGEVANVVNQNTTNVVR